jgi:hypothetical protein
MKRNWPIEELVAHFTLTPDELALLAGKLDFPQLGQPAGLIQNISPHKLRHFLLSWL